MRNVSEWASVYYDLVGRHPEGDEEAMETEDMGWTHERVVEELAEIAFDKKQHAPSRVKAFELLGKHLGMWPRVPKPANVAEKQAILVMPEPAVDADEFSRRAAAELRSYHAGESKH